MKVSLICLTMILIDVSLSTNNNIEVDDQEGKSRVLSRRKRFIIFPTGSSFSVAACMTVGMYGNVQFSIMSWALNYGFAYNLPTNSSYFTNIPDDVFNFPFFDEMSKLIDPPTTTTPEPETVQPDHDDHDHDHHHDAPSAPSAPSDPTGMSPPAPPSQRRFYKYYQPKYETKPMVSHKTALLPFSPNFLNIIFAAAASLSSRHLSEHRERHWQVIELALRSRDWNEMIFYCFQNGL